MSTHVVMFSGGLGSWLTAKRVADQHGTDNLILLFADVKGDSTSPHVGEDEDTYRFIREAAADIRVCGGCGGSGLSDEYGACLDCLGAGSPLLVTVKDGRNIWEVFKDDRFLGNSRLANCSKFLKQKPCRDWLEDNCDPDDTIVYVGIDWSESHRLPAIEAGWAPYPVVAPMTEPPLLNKSQMQTECLRAGIALPRLYRAGFPHNNPMAGETRVITTRGTKTLAELAGDGVVTLLGRRSRWVDATIQSFGLQPLQEIVLTRNGRTKSVWATPDHRWFRRNGRDAQIELVTAELEPGHQLVSMYSQAHATVRPSAFGVAHGITFGDGTSPRYRDHRAWNPPANVVLCGEKDVQLLHWFPLSPTTDVPGVGIRVGDLPQYFKTRPSLLESKSYLFGWLAGYFAADGTVATDGQASISSASLDDLEFARDVATLLGLRTNGIRRHERTGYGEGPTPLYTLPFQARTLPERFYLIQEHRARAKFGKPRSADWRVVEVKPPSRFEEVFCALVPDGHSFALEDNILTGNCGGFCVRAGQAQMELLLREHPERYKYAEEREQELRDHLDADVSVLKDRTGGEATPLTLRAFRERIEDQPELFDPLDFGGCGCFTDDTDGAA